MQNGNATDAQDLSFEDPQSHAPPESNGTSSPNGHFETTDDESIEADDTSVEGDIAASLFDPGLSPSGLEVDTDSQGGDVEEGSHSLYAFSTYPRIQAAFQVEHPFDTTPDSATIDSSRTLYAEDLDYVFEHGRRFCGDYSMPNDVTEQTRQYVIHQVYLKLFDLELTTVPLQDPKYILDIGTGIGEWAIGIAEKYPDCEVFGTDIAAIQPTDQVPFNVEFHIEDAEEEWIRPANEVDLVHIRNMAGAFRDWTFIYQQAFNCIKPGGYIEVLDFDDHRGYKNFASWFPEGSAISLMTNALRQASELDGRPKGVEHMARQRLMDAGFVDIQETQHDIPLGRQENPKFGEDWLFAVVTGVEATCLRLLTKYMGWEADYVRGLCDEVSHELKKMAEDPRRARGFVVKLRVLVGRKPEVAGQWTAQSLTENGEMREFSEDESTVGSRAGLGSVRGDASFVSQSDA